MRRAKEYRQRISRELDQKGYQSYLKEQKSRSFGGARSPSESVNNRTAPVSVEREEEDDHTEEDLHKINQKLEGIICIKNRICDENTESH